MFGGGNNNNANPMSGMLKSVFDAAGDTFSFGTKAGAAPKAPAPPPTLITERPPAPAPQSVDTPGRHKTLLGA